METTAISVRNLQLDAEPISEIVGNFGSLSRRQIQLLCGSADRADRIINYLKRNRLARITEDGSHVVAYFNKKVDPDIERAFWILMYHACHKDENGEMQVDFDFLRGAAPADVYTKAVFPYKDTCYKAVCIDQHNIGSVFAAINSFCALMPENIMASCCYIFVIDDIIMLDKINAMNFSYRHKIALVVDTKKGIPEIKFFKAKKR